jgi:hypothetical protein
MAVNRKFAVADDSRGRSAPAHLFAAASAEGALSRIGLTEVARDADGTFGGLCVSPAQGAFLFRSSVLGFFSGCVAVARGHADLAWVPFSVCTTSLLYWHTPDFSWRRYLDMSIVQVCLFYQVRRAVGAENAVYYYGIKAAAAAAFLAGVWVDKRSPATSSWVSVLWHGCVHVFANIANVVLYAGCVPRGGSSCAGAPQHGAAPREGAL